MLDEGAKDGDDLVMFGMVVWYEVAIVFCRFPVYTRAGLDD